MAYFLSIVVPTKNRYKYLKYFVEYIDNTFADESVELIIQDNSDDNTEITDFLKGFQNSNIKYFYNAGHLSLKDNADMAVKNSSGEWVMFLGDDDCFLPSLINTLNQPIVESYEAIVTPRLIYVWPDAKDYINYLRTDEYLVNYTKEVKEIDTSAELDNVLRQGGQYMNNLPRLYHGIVRRSALNRVWDQYETYFPGPSPDMANAMALTLLGIKTLYIDYPGVIGGTGYSRVEGNKKADKQSLKESTFLPADTEEKWNPRIPKFWSSCTIFAQTVLQVINETRPELAERFNWDSFYVNMGSWFWGPFWKKCREEKKFELIPRVISMRSKAVLYRNFKNIINSIRGYKRYNLNETDVISYAKSVEQNIGELKIK